MTAGGGDEGLGDIKVIDLHTIAYQEMIDLKKEVITLPGTRSRPFSSAVRAGDFTSGHAGMHDSEGKELKSIEEQARQTLESLKATLEAAGATLNDVVKVT